MPDVPELSQEELEVQEAPDEGLGALAALLLKLRIAFPMNRVVAFLGPYISVASGTIATWLLVHVHLFALFHVTHDRIASAIAQAAVFIVSTGVTWLGQQKWLQGHIEIEKAIAGAVPVSASTGPGAMPELPPPDLDHERTEPGKPPS